MKMSRVAQLPRTFTPAATTARPHRRSSYGNHTSVHAKCEPCDCRETLQPTTCQQSSAPTYQHDFSQIPVHSGLPGQFQLNLPVSTPGDLYERGADAMADQAMRLPGIGSDSRQPDQEYFWPSGAGNIERGTLSFMQRRFGADFSDVRLHTDASAARMSQEFDAQAFTIGRDVYFGTGQYAPYSDRGRRLLAHELAHTIQQGHSRVRRFSRPAQQGIAGLVNIPEKTSGDEQEEATLTEPMIQRSATWKGAAVHETLSPADLVLSGTLPNTWPVLNGKSLQTTDAAAAIKVPTVATSGSGTSWKAQVSTVPAQEGSADETVLHAGPWTRAVTKAAVRQATGLAACTGPGNSTFSVHGQKTDDAVSKANRRHEDRHVADDKTAFENTIVNWDKKVQEAKDKAVEFKGPSAGAATGALWAAMGNTPGSAATSYASQVNAAGKAYHATPAGGENVLFESPGQPGLLHVVP